jgi:hypothetical protein
MEPHDTPLLTDPPPDPDEWSHEQWLEWLNASDASFLEVPDDRIATVVSHVVQSSAGQMIGQAMLGMAQAIYGKKDEELVIVASGDSEPEGDEQFVVRLDFDHPELSSVVFHDPQESSGEQSST